MGIYDRKGCPNLDVRVEGKTLFNSGRWVARCRAQGGREMAPDQVVRLCVDNAGLDFGQCCNLANSRRNSNSQPSYARCNYCSSMYR